MNKYQIGDVVTIREGHEPAKIVNTFPGEENEECFYEVKAINLENVPTREVKESDLRRAHRIVEIDNGPWRYFDKDWNELHAGDTIRHPSGEEQRLYLTVNGLLGVDATNPKWIESGRANPCEYGIYPLEHDDVTYGAKVI